MKYRHNIDKIRKEIMKSKSDTVSDNFLYIKKRNISSADSHKFEDTYRKEISKSLKKEWKAKSIHSNVFLFFSFFFKYFTWTICLFKDGEINKRLLNKSTEFLQLWTYSVYDIQMIFYNIKSWEKNVIMKFLINKKNNERKTKKKCSKISISTEINYLICKRK